MDKLLLIILSSFALTYRGTLLFKQWAIQKAILDIPNARSAHAVPTPRGGGIVFVTIFYVLLIILWRYQHLSTRLLLALLGGIPIAIVGYCDDLYTLRIQWRALVHVIIAIWGVLWLDIVNPFIAIFAILSTAWFINLYNFMDGIDGLAASEAAFVALVSGVMLLSSAPSVGMLSLGLGAAVLGFLCWNWAPAKIFMGDVGSGFLGYCFAILMWYTVHNSLLPLVFWWVLLALFLCDATFTLLFRMQQKKRWYLPHREHIYQRLVHAGFQHRQITLGALMINVFLLLPLGLWILQLRTPVNMDLSALLIASVVGLCWFYLHKKYPVI